MQTPTHPATTASPALVAELIAQLKRTTFLLNSARLVITDGVARDLVKEAVDDARATLTKAIGVAP